MEKTILTGRAGRAETRPLTGLAGFDAVVDHLVHVVRTKDADGRSVYFRTMSEFARHVAEKAGMSCSMELELVRSKLGGNMAIYANALGRLGVRMRCVGSFGGGRGDPAFDEMDPNCERIGICEPGSCHALEFDDGKVMLSSMDLLRALTWEQIEALVGPEALKRWVRESDVLALLNWSEVEGSTALFRQMYDATLAGLPPDKSRLVFLDLSDASRKRDDEVLAVLALVEDYARKRAVVLSVNENECRILGRALGLPEGLPLKELGAAVKARCAPDCLVLHLLDRALAFSDAGAAERPGYFIETPLFATGGGDNFNAGLTYGLLTGRTLEDCLDLGNAVSGCYVRTGRSPSLEEAMQFMRAQEKEGREC